MFLNGGLTESILTRRVSIAPGTGVKLYAAAQGE